MRLYQLVSRKNFSKILRSFLREGVSIHPN